jgi:hypothetical protein
MLIQDGQIIKSGDPTKIADMYSELNKRTYHEQKQRAEQANQPEGLKITVLNAETQKPQKIFSQGEDALIELSWNRTDVMHAGVALYKQSGEYIFGPNTFKEGRAPLRGDKLQYRVRLDVGTGEYYLKAGIFGANDRIILEFVDDGPYLTVEGKAGDSSWEGITHLKHTWLEPGSRSS